MNLQSMPELTYQNHFKFGYNNSWFNSRVHSEDKWMVEYGRCSQEPGNFGAECINAAKLIGQSTERTPWLFLSGGIDSEVMALSFLKAKIPFIGVTLKFSEDLNSHDLFFVKKFLKSHKIEHEFFEIDILKFFRSEEFNELSRQTQCVTPQFPALMKLMKIISRRGGFPVIGSGECHFKYENKHWVMYEREKVACLYRYLLLNNTAGCAGFFQYTPGQILSFIQDPIMQDLFSGVYSEMPSNFSLKHKIYSNYFKIEERPKYTGYEKVKKEDAHYRNNLTSLFPFSDVIAKTSYKSLVASLK